MPDTLLQMGDSVVQHGPHSNRIYALKLAAGDLPDILDDFAVLAEEQDYGKITAKARREDFDDFMERGYRPEALVPEFYGPGEDLLFMGKFLDPRRTRDHGAQRVQEVLQVASTRGLSPDPGEGAQTGERSQLSKESGPADVDFREAGEADLGAIAQIYQEVFESYPFPIQDPDHLLREMNGGTRFFTAYQGDSLVASSSMESGGVAGTVEMTDFATLPSQRGEGLATHLLAIMEKEAKKTRVRVAYTIARAISFGMNITFARRGYTFGGTLVNNTQIGGAIESMNVWYKALKAQ